VQQDPAPKIGPRCNGHKLYATRALAEDAMAKTIAQEKSHGRHGKSHKRLNVFHCRECGQYHVGHGKQSWPVNKQAEPKQPSPGQLRRQLAHEQKEAARHAKRAALFSDYIENQRIAYAELDKELELTAAAARK
jgi:hypothetical protein